jgi:hypothetical protein
VTETVAVEPATAPLGAVTATVRTGTAVVVVVAESVAGAAPSGASVRVALVTSAPGVDENATLGVIGPRAVPATMGVVAVEVQVSSALPPLLMHVHPAGVGSAVKVAPDGAVIVSCGSESAGLPEAFTDGVTVTVAVEPATAAPGPVTETVSTGAVIVVADWTAGVAPSVVSVSVADVTSAPGADESSTLVSIGPSAVPAGMGVVAVDVQVSTVSAPESAHDQPVGVGSVVKVAPVGAVTVSCGSA